MRRSNAKRPEKMEQLKLQMRPNATARAQKNATRSNLVVLILLATVIAAFFLLLVLVCNSRNSMRRGKKYGIVIDGGSTGTRIHVFGFELDGGGRPVFDFGKKGLGSMRVSPGLSSYAEDPNRSGGSLVELLEFGKSRVPKEHWGDTEIRLMATAGLRRLELRVQEAILESCRRVLRVSGFQFRDSWASVITGSDEGIYAWVVANHALGSLGGDPRETTGIIELGGASAQVTFVSSEPVPPEFSHTLRFGNVTYNLYSHSLLDFGQNVALESLQKSLYSTDLMGFLPSKWWAWSLIFHGLGIGILSELLTLSFLHAAAESLQKGILIDPCTPKGYSLDGKNEYSSAIHAQGNFSECRAAALTLLQKGKERCSYHHCLGSTFMPKLQGKFLATENFFYTSKFFGLGSRAFLSDLTVAGQHFCEEDWSKLKRKYYSFNEEDLLHYCFSSAYIVAFLHDSLGIALDDERIGYANQVGDIPLDWALGAFILQSTTHLEAEHSDWITTVVSDESPTLLSLVVILIILMFTVWSISKCKKPQLKTIYDLEKGRYIVTRINRCS